MDTLQKKILCPSILNLSTDNMREEIEKLDATDMDIYHVDIMESFEGIDLDAAGRVSGNGFYYLLGDIARLHEAVLAYARDFMINKGFTYVIPPFMMHGNVVQGVMSFPEMDAMMYKIEGEDLYLIGTSEHTMIGRFIDQTIDESKMPLQVILRNLVLANQVNIGSSGAELADRTALANQLKYVVVTLAAFPLIIVYPFVQKYFAKGVMIGAVKG